MRRSLLVVAALLASAASVRAQTLVGTIRDSVTGRAIAGAVVVQLDAQRRDLGRRTTGGDGRFVAALAADAKRVRVVRLGFRARELDLPVIEGGVGRLDVRMIALPTLLEPVEAIGRAKCPMRSDRAAAFALLEQARAGLLTTIAARDADTATMVRYGFQHALDDGGERIERQVIRADSADRSTASFSAVRKAVDFVKQGFAAGDVQQTFYAPDADVLLDDAFADGYCFSVVADRSHPRLIGLGFAPADRRTGRVDVEGTVWIDSTARALREVSYRYRGLDNRAERLKPGGNISFAEVSPGIVLIDHWLLRLVRGVYDTVSVRAPLSGTSGSRIAPEVRMIPLLTESGGEVGRIQWRDGRSWKGSLGSLRLKLTRELDRAAPGRSIALIGAPYKKGLTVSDAPTPYQAVSDSTGAIAIDGLLPGPYSVVLTDARLAPLKYDLPTPFTFVAARDSVVSGTLAAPTLEDVIGRACEDDGGAHNDSYGQRIGYGPADTSVLLGRVMSTRGEPIEKVDVKISADFAAPNSLAHNWLEVGSYKTGTDGLFHLCVERWGAGVKIEARRGGRLIGGAEFPAQGRLIVAPILVDPNG